MSRKSEFNSKKQYQIITIIRKFLLFYVIIFTIIALISSFSNSFYLAQSIDYIEYIKNNISKFISFVSALVIVYIYSLYYLVYKRRMFRSALQPRSPENWTGRGPLRISVPSQGVTLLFDGMEDLREMLADAVLQVRMLCDRARHENAPNTLVLALENHAEQLDEFDVALGSGDHGSVKKLHNALSFGRICLPSSAVGTFIFGFDRLAQEHEEAQSLALRLLAFMMFYKADTGSGTYAPLSNEDNKHEFFETYPDLRGSGESQVLYNISLNTSETLTQIQQEREELAELKEQINQALANARSTLKLKPAANRWRRSARWASGLAFLGLLPFLMLLIGIPALLFTKWGVVSDAVSSFMAPDEAARAAIETWKGFFAEAPWATLVFVTVPFLVFAWILKHFSRIFVQNMNLAADFGRRAALADVYTRIVSDPDLNKDNNRITDDQKRIIFEAMFKQRDSLHNDEGIDYTAVEKLAEVVKRPS